MQSVEIKITDGPCKGQVVGVFVNDRGFPYPTVRVAKAQPVPKRLLYGGAAYSAEGPETPIYTYSLHQWMDGDLAPHYELRYDE